MLILHFYALCLCSACSIESCRDCGTDVGYFLST